MKQNGSAITLLSLFIVAFWSCVSRPDEIVTTLQRAESCMEMYPDSAWHLLSGISDPDDLSDKKRADYVLLLTQARDKNYMDMSADSSITLAVDYFKKSGDKRKHGKSLYYYGRVFQGKKEVTRAMKAFLDARQLLEETTEYKIMGLLFEDMSVLNREQSLYDEAINDCRQAITYYYQAKDTLGVAYAYQTMGSCFFLKQEMDSVYQCATRSLQLLANNPLRLKIRANKLLGRIYCFKRRYSEAEKIFLKVIEEEPDESKLVLHYMSLGHLYQLMGRKDDAKRYLEFCVHSSNLFTCSDAYNCLSELAKADHNYEQAFILKEKSDSLFSLAENEKKRETLVRYQAEYHKSKSEEEKRQIWLENKTTNLMYVVIFILLLGVVYRFYKKYWRANLEIIQIRKALDKNERRILAFQSEIEMHKQQSGREEVKVSTEIDKSCCKKDVLTLQDENLRSKIDVVELVGMLKKGNVFAEKLTDDEWNRIFDLANSLYSDVLSKLKNERSKLTKHDIKLLAFLLFGFTTKELMVVFDSKDGHTISKAKLRLKERLELVKEESVDDFLKKCRGGK